jgi:dihydrofolate reductase
MSRRINLWINSSVNSVITGDPGGDKTDFGVWTRQGNILSGSEAILRLLDPVDTLLLGRGTYDDLVRKWPAMQGPPGAGDVVSRLAAKINGAHKLVATRNRQLTDLPWGGFEAAQPLGVDDVVADVQEFTSGEGGDAVIFGSPELVRTLAAADVIDAYHVAVHPVIVEVGERLFDGITTRKSLQLTTVTTLDDSGVVLSYIPAGS